MSDVQMGGDGDTDDQISESYGAAADDTAWTPLAWHYSPQQLIEQARADNEAGYRGAFANAGKHSNPPNFPVGHYAAD